MDWAWRASETSEAGTVSQVPGQPVIHRATCSENQQPALNCSAAPLQS